MRCYQCGCEGECGQKEDRAEKPSTVLVQVDRQPIKLTSSEKDLLVDAIGPSGILELDIYPLFESGIFQLDMDDLRRRAKSFGELLGERHANAFKKAKAIPEEWQSYTLVFPGTEWIDQYGHHYVRILQYVQSEGWVRHLSRPIGLTDFVVTDVAMIVAVRLKIPRYLNRR